MTSTELLSRTVPPPTAPYIHQARSYAPQALCCPCSRSLSGGLTSNPPGLPIPPKSQTSPDPDRPLIELCDLYLRQEQEISDQMREDDERYGVEVPEDVENRLDEMLAAQRGTLEQIGVLSATTPAGLVAKARVSIVSSGNRNEPAIGRHEQITWALADDLIRMFGP